MRKIKLTQGKYALVDDKNYEWLNQWKWNTFKTGQSWYAHTRMGSEKVSMHRLILGLSKGDGKQTDHANHNGLDNREFNLRICNSSQNAINKRKLIKTTSKYKGVWLVVDNRSKKEYRYWRSGIRVDGKRKYLGCFKSEIKAAKAYDVAAKELFGKFANCNFK